MKRTTKTLKLGEGRVRYVVTVEGDPSREGGPDGRRGQHELLKMLVDNPMLMLCGPASFEKLTISYRGQSWVMDMEATVDDPTYEADANGA